MIPAWDLGLLDMCVGELRELIVPPAYGYGDMPVGDTIPPKAILVFYVTLGQIQDGDTLEEEVRPNMFSEIDVNGDGLISHGEVSFPDSIDWLDSAEFFLVTNQTGAV